MTIAFYIQKGGVGKTTLSGNIAYMASQKKKTVIIDADPQGNVSSWLLDEPPNYELSDLLQDKVSLDDTLVKISDNFFILPTFGIGGGLKQYGETKLNDEPFIFQELVKLLKNDKFQCIIFDLSPGFSKLEKSVILAVDEVLTPITPEAFAVDGLEIFTPELSKLNKAFRTKVNHNKIICNNFNSTMLVHRKYLRQVRAVTGYDVFEVPQEAQFKTSQDNNKTLYQWNPKSKAIPELQRLTESIINGI